MNRFQKKFHVKFAIWTSDGQKLCEKSALAWWVMAEAELESIPREQASRRASLATHGNGDGTVGAPREWEGQEESDLTASLCTATPPPTGYSAAPSGTPIALPPYSPSPTLFPFAPLPLRPLAVAASCPRGSGIAQLLHREKCRMGSRIG